MSIRDIITGAVQAEERLDHGPDDGMDGWALAADNTFILVFGPKHVALMEAVVDAAQRVDKGGMYAGPSKDRMVASLDALAAYRKEAD